MDVFRTVKLMTQSVKILCTIPGLLWFTGASVLIFAVNSLVMLPATVGIYVMSEQPQTEDRVASTSNLSHEMDSYVISASHHYARPS